MKRLLLVKSRLNIVQITEYLVGQNKPWLASFFIPVVNQMPSVFITSPSVPGWSLGVV